VTSHSSPKMLSESLPNFFPSDACPSALRLVHWTELNWTLASMFWTNPSIPLEKVFSAQLNYVKVKVILRPTVSRSVCLAVRHPSGTRNQFVLLISLIIFRLLRLCWSGAPPLTRGRVCSFQFLLGIASAICLGSESHGTHDHILFSIFETPQPGGPGSCIYFSQEKGCPVMPSRIGFV
jgi:hypothetical protein